MSQQQTETSIFDAAKAIVEALKGLDKPSQTLALRFASESLGLSAGSNTGAAGGRVRRRRCPSPNFVAQHTQQTSSNLRQPRRPRAINSLRPSPRTSIDLKRPSRLEKILSTQTRLRKPLVLRVDGRLRIGAFTLTNAKNSGYLDSAGSGQYRINSVGENLVAIALPGDDSESAPKRPSKRKATKNSSGTKRNAKPRR